MANKYIQILIRFLKENEIYYQSGLNCLIKELKDGRGLLPHLYFIKVYTSKYNGYLNSKVISYSNNYIEVISNIYTTDIYNILNREYNNLLKNVDYNEFKELVINGIKSYELSANLYKLENKLTKCLNGNNDFYYKLLDAFTYE